MTLETCGTISTRAQIILVWVKALDIENTFYLHRLIVTKVRPRALDSSWSLNSRVLKITSIEGVS